MAPSKADFPSLAVGWSCWALGMIPLEQAGTGGHAQPRPPLHRQGSKAASACPGSWDALNTMGSMPEAPVEAEFQLQPAIPAQGLVKPGVHSR